MFPARTPPSLPPPLPALPHLTPPRWHHIAVTYEPSAWPLQLSGYLDGALAISIAAFISLPPASSSVLALGWSGDLAGNGGGLFAGSLADLRVYNSTLCRYPICGQDKPAPTDSSLTHPDSP